MAVPRFLASTRARILLVAAVGVVFTFLWRQLTPPPVSTPKRIASLPRHDSGYWFNLAERVREGAGQDPRLGATAAAAYGHADQPMPTLGVLASVISFGHGPEIAGSVVAGLTGGGAVLGPLSPAPAGKHGGTFQCGAASFGVDSGTYCVWWNTDAIGIAVVTGLDAAASQKLALNARNATQR